MKQTAILGRIDIHLFSMFNRGKNSMLQPSDDNVWQTQRTFDACVNLNCKKEYVICLLKCILFKIQYVRKAETSFNLRLNNHRKDSKEVNSILACNHNFKDIISTKHVNLIMIDKLIILNHSKQALWVVRKIFLVQKIKVLVPFGLNFELSKWKGISCWSLSV